jgi:hypothetical protein
MTDRACALAVVISATLLFASLSCGGGGYYLGLPKASPEAGYGIVGYVDRSSREAAPAEVVTLKDGTTGKVVARVTTDYVGVYRFYPLQPGAYILEVGEILRQVVIENSHRRIDIDLGAPHRPGP